MKGKKLICLLMILSLLFCAVDASAAALTRTNYETIINNFRDAMAAETQEEALQILKNLCVFYEKPGRSEALEKYEGGKAYVYYTYAKGVIAFGSEAYAEAEGCFELLQGIQTDTESGDLPPLPDTTYYYQFSLAMNEFEKGEYGNAFAALEAARTAPGASAIDCQNARNGFVKAIKQNAEERCASGDHLTAQQYYQVLIDQNVAEAKALLAKCAEHSATAALAITAAEATGTDTIALGWQGSAPAYRVCWSADPTGESGVSAQIVQGNSVTLSSLLPGTDYRITIDQTAPDSPLSLRQPKPDTEGVAEITVRTLNAKKYPSKSVQFVRASVVGVDPQALMLKTPLEIVELLPANYHLENSNDSFTESDLQSFRLCCLISYRNLIGQDVNGPVICLLRAPDAGVFVSKVRDDLPADSNVFDVFLDELLEMAEEAHGDLPKGEYAWEIYVDDQLFCKGTFVIKNRES